MLGRLESEDPFPKESVAGRYKVKQNLLEVEKAAQETEGRESSALL